MGSCVGTEKSARSKPALAPLHKSQQKKEYDYSFKIVVVGDSGCGKSSIVVRYVDGSFSGTVLASTESGYREKSFEMDGKRIQLRIFDTASQERFRTITSSYYDGAHGALIVFDLERRSTFEHIDDWTNDVERYSSKIRRIVVGNKSDKNETRSVADSVASNRARNLGMSYLETSAKDGSGVDDAFILLVRQMMQKDAEDVFGTDRNESSASHTESDNISMPPSIRSITSTFTPSESFVASTLRSRGTLGESDDADSSRL